MSTAQWTLVERSETSRPTYEAMAALPGRSRNTLQQRRERQGCAKGA